VQIYKVAPNEAIWGQVKPTPTSYDHILG